MIKPEQLLLIDIETVPLYKSYDELPDKLKPLWDRKSLQINPDESNTANMFSERAGIYAEFGKIICISLGYLIKKDSNYQLKVKTLASNDEKELLKDFIQICNKFFTQATMQFCGHNIREFDIPYICRRTLINRLDLPNILLDLQQKKPWENPMLDTLQFWKFGEYKNFVSVDLLATILEIESPKYDINGSDVARVYWQENDLDRIKNYCNRDIVTVAQILMRLIGKPLLAEDSIVMTN